MCTPTPFADYKKESKLFPVYLDLCLQLQNFLHTVYGSCENNTTEYNCKNTFPLRTLIFFRM